MSSNRKKEEKGNGVKVEELLDEVEEGVEEEAATSSSIRSSFEK